MNKPLGYFTSHTPGDAGTLADLEEAYGSQLEKLNNAERLAMITAISTVLSIEYSIIDAPYNSQIFEIIPKINELPASERRGLISCLISGLAATQVLDLRIKFLQGAGVVIREDVKREETA